MSKNPTGLNQRQAEAVDYEGNLLLVAPPGSGKTHTLVRKVVRTLEHPRARVLLTTFSRDAADEMTRRVKQAAGARAAARVVSGTFHSLAMRQLREAGALPRLLNAVDSRHLMRSALHQVGMPISVEDAEAMVYRAKSGLLPAGDHHGHDLARAYQALVEQRGACDYTDLILLASKLLKERRINPYACTHLMADEYQDVDGLQMEWLSLNVGPATAVTVVADDDQSIYAFRAGLGYAGLEQFVQKFRAHQLCLQENYRSTAGIVGAASRLIAFNGRRIQKTVHAARGAGEHPQLYLVESEAEQAERLVAILSELCRDNPIEQSVPGIPYRFGVREGQVAVLARSNQELFDVECEFLASRVPYKRSGRSMLDMHEMQVFMSLLQSLLQGDGVGIEVALRWSGRGESRMSALIDQFDHDLTKIFAPDAPPLAKRFGPEAGDLQSLGRVWMRDIQVRGEREARSVVSGVASWMLAVLTNTCGEPEDEPDPPDAKTKVAIRTVEAGRNILLKFSGDLRSRLALISRRREERSPCVMLSTFHAAKGLEWDNVFLINLREGRVPKCEEDAPTSEYEEERRAFYVAMTRARDRLYLFSTGELAKRSLFLVEAGFVDANQWRKARELRAAAAAR